MTDVQPTMNLLGAIVDRHIELEEEAERDDAEPKK